MAEEVEMIPVDAAEPPKANPLAKPAVPKPSTIKLSPAARPVTATNPMLKPGLKLPPKPNATQVGLKPGLKLPPKPGLTQTGLKPGLKLPPKPGMTQTALKPGLKLPTKPIIRKPGATASATPLPKPISSVPPPVTPAAPAAAATSAPAAAPAATPTLTAAAPKAPARPMPIDQLGVGKLPTVEMNAVDRNAEHIAAEKPNTIETLKSVTQKLKGITQHIPAQAVLHKTGIIADNASSESQKEASKHKTARISLADAMGVAPVKNEAAPMKTIKIKRPIDIPGATKTALSPVKPAATTTAPAAEAPKDDAAADAAKSPTSTSVTQRKTLKIARPGGGAVRPTGKFGIKRPTVQAAPAAAPSAPADGSVAPLPADGAVADIPDIPSAIPPVPMAQKAPASEGPAWLWSLLIVVQAAACVAMGALAWMLLQNVQTNFY